MYIYLEPEVIFIQKELKKNLNECYKIISSQLRKINVNVKKYIQYLICNVFSTGYTVLISNYKFGYAKY